MDEATAGLLEDDAAIRDSIVRIEFSIRNVGEHRDTLTVTIPISATMLEDRSMLESYISTRVPQLVIQALREIPL